MQLTPVGSARHATGARGQIMYVCVICRFEVELDDAVAPTATGHCVCVRCFARETESEHSMDKPLRQAILDVLAEAEAIQPG
jgi:hypothetical protein